MVFVPENQAAPLPSARSTDKLFVLTWAAEAAAVLLLVEQETHTERGGTNDVLQFCAELQEFNTPSPCCLLEVSTLSLSMPEDA